MCVAPAPLEDNKPPPLPDTLSRDLRDCVTPAPLLDSPTWPLASAGSEIEVSGCFPPLEGVEAEPDVLVQEEGDVVVLPGCGPESTNASSRIFKAFNSRQELAIRFNTVALFNPVPLPFPVT